MTETTFDLTSIGHDIIVVKGIEGTVERFGFRSVEFLGGEGLLVAISNRIAADSLVQNLSKRDFTREYFCFGVVY